MWYCTQKAQPLICEARSLISSSTDMPRKARSSQRRKLAGLRKLQARKAPKYQKSRPTRKSRRSPKRLADDPALAMIRPPPPGQGKRGEQGYLAYLLRQAQAATRLTMERALAGLGVTTPQFVALTMLRA
jgi:hypothetical protein